MRHCSGYSSAENVTIAIEEAVSGLGQVRPKLILFASDDARFAAFAEGLHQRYPDAEAIGATTYIALSDRGCAKSALSLMALYGDMECRAGVLTDIVRYPMKHKAVVEECLKRLEVKEHLLCFEMMTAFSNAEELVLDTFKAALGEEIPVVGSSAGASEAANADGVTRTRVSINGRVYEEACVFALISSPRRVRVYLENIFTPTERCLVATDVDCERHMVYEFDSRPAARVLAEALGVGVDQLQGALGDHPLGRVIRDQIYLVEGLRVHEDEEVEFFARIYNNTRIALMRLSDYRRINAETMAKIRADSPDPAFCLVVHCLGRSKLFEGEGYLSDFERCLSASLGDYFGMSGYGEQLNGQHLNASMVVAVFE